jgi:PhzF family phenazine biosynthesis protein
MHGCGFRAHPVPIGLPYREAAMKLRLWQVDAFTQKVFAGNPAGVVPLDAWPDAALMQAIAAENNLAETAFFVRTAPGAYDLRWFTPNSEVDLCGHATLASADVIFRHVEPDLHAVRFQTRSGELRVTRGEDGRNAMALPSAASGPFTPPQGFPAALAKALGAPGPQAFHYAEKGGAGTATLIGVWASPEAVLALKPGTDLQALLMSVKAGSLIATAPGGAAPYDFVSRFFAPYFGVPEDPVTGSAHTALTPFWAARLGKKTLLARQASSRGGDILCTDDGAQVILQGSCAIYLTGEIEV